MSAERFEDLSFTPDHDAGRAALEEAVAPLSAEIRGLARAAYEAGATAAEAQARPARMLALDPEAPITPRGARIGGPAWRPEGAGWPMDAEHGQALMLLAQLDCAALGIEGFPQGGLLQIFINADLLAFDNRAHVEWHADPRGERTLPQPGGAQGPFPDEAACARGLAVAHGPAGQMRPTVDDEALQDALREATAGAEAPAGGQAQDLAHDALAEALTPAWAHHAGGHPVSCQGEVHFSDAVEDGPAVPYDRCLLRLGWDQETIMWGDAGEAVVLVTAQDLAARDFSRAYFYWDSF